MKIMAMNHDEAVQQMATEKYLLDELSPELREAFEEHFFDCPECALDLHAAVTFVEEAKTQLPELTGPFATPQTAMPGMERPATPAKAAREQKAKAQGLPWWHGLLRPMIAGPVFAALLVMVGYQNLVTMPALRASANEPLLSPMLYLHAGTRGGQETPVEVDRKRGIALVVDKPQQAGFASYRFELRDAEGKLAAGVTAASDSQAADATLSLAIPGAALREGAYTLAISGIGPSGSATEIERHALEIHLRN